MKEILYNMLENGIITNIEYNFLMAALVKEDGDKVSPCKTTVTNNKITDKKPEANRSFGNYVAMVLCEIEEMLRKKNQDYGNSFHNSFIQFGVISPVVRLNDKMQRLNTLTTNTGKPNYEGIEDTLKDIIGYCVLTLIELGNGRGDKK